MIEPAAYGVAVCYGEQTRNFRDVVEQLAARDAATVVRDGHELADFMRTCHRDPHFRDSMGRRAQQVVFDNQGALDRTLDHLLPLLPPVSRPQAA